VPHIDPLAVVYRRTAGYYGAKVREYGATPLGADWRCEPTQLLRFVQLLRLCAGTHAYSLDDLGCGYGALLHFLGRRRMLRRVDYLGIDLSPDMIDSARRARPRHAHRFVVGTRSPRRADYSVASGIFNVRLDVPLVLWESFVRQTLRELFASSRYGLAVNFMEPVTAGLRSPPELYRPGAQRWVDYLENELGLRVEPVRGYGLREVTLLARRP
jgi:SAM-dependent methyltransferase